jgi:hypothetical protein
MFVTVIFNTRCPDGFAIPGDACCSTLYNPNETCKPGLTKMNFCQMFHDKAPIEIKMESKLVSNA